MPKVSINKTSSKTDPKKKSPFQLKKVEKKDPNVHVYRSEIVCKTEQIGKRTPSGKSPLEIEVDASEGFIPLWRRDVTLRWRFNETSIKAFENPAAAKSEIRKLLGEAV